MSLTLITPPPVEPLQLQDVKDFLRIDGSDEDTLLQSLITAARQRYDGEDGMLGRALVQQSWEYRLDSFPRSALEIPLPPLQSVDSVTYTDPDGNSQTLTDGTDFRVDSWSEPGRIVAVDTWPATAQLPAAIVIAFTAGYAPDSSSPPDYTANLPEQLRTAMLQTIGTWYDASRTSVAVDMGRPRPIPQTGDDLARAYKVAWSF
jgi:uncharacterized phiE125 gp8 family phage protein